ncbi:unnamed protein product (macronuclear) [Paramecium tetraurelia]|uniref:Uncharacterized protein n=1 Tax=Paramecium tetraurelia TaxID=5888 RepID=A0CB37_PARTE|nr:uncharacterized protein GSPATT00036787001 [Paramecium tetraurelia]CAK68004.1 unnamed protein product [Paramecium tetraurelia]|eukprot:XP_001435401.1 hypothetical protein (macronuclear) [Paramecium tetraurelia strain d4-2]
MQNKQEFSNEYKVMKDNKFQNKITNLGGEDTNMISITSAIYAFLKGRSTLKEPIRNTSQFQREKQNNIEPQRIITINPRQIEADRLLCTNDIDGAVPGSLQSQAVRNHDVAQKLRIQRDEQRAQRKRALYQSQIEQSQEVQERESPSPYRNKSLSVQLSPVQPTQPYEYMNKPLKLPPVSDRITTYTNPANNSKLQLRQNHQTFLSQEQEKTLKFIKKQPALRLFV